MGRWAWTLALFCYFPPVSSCFGGWIGSISSLPSHFMIMSHHNSNHQATDGGSSFHPAVSFQRFKSTSIASKASKDSTEVTVLGTTDDDGERKTRSSSALPSSSSSSFSSSSQRPVPLRPWSIPHLLELQHRDETKHNDEENNRERNSSLHIRDLMQERTQSMMSRAQQGIPLTESELDLILNSLQNLFPADAATPPVDWTQLRHLLAKVAHISHKDWSVTERNGWALGHALCGESTTSTTTTSFPNDTDRCWLERILVQGQWDQAVAAAATTTTTAPWAVLVTGVNGIRKTTSMYQRWFPALLQEALVAPAISGSASLSSTHSPGLLLNLDELPTGHNSFFRQLDHMIATLCNEEFAILYHLTSELWKGELEEKASQEASTSASVSELQEESAPPGPPAHIVHLYSDLKAAIFARYRTLSELLGAFLLHQAQQVRSNCLMETSGRDVAMFQYVDHFFPSSPSSSLRNAASTPSSGYRKLALHFTINDLSQAQESVDRRMVQEIKAGLEALQHSEGSAMAIVYTNAGGPYGSQVLPDVEKASNQVWQDLWESQKYGPLGQDWYKATIHIQAHPTEPWTAQAVRPDGSLGTLFTFERL